MNYLRDDPRLGPQAALSVHVSRVIDVATDQDRAVLELTVNARVNPTDAGAIKQELLDRIGGALVGLATGKQDSAQPVK
jgi:small conductance mechanosensitive channel